jgi:hypothetical protein
MRAVRIGRVVAVVAAVASLSGLYNVLGDNAVVQAQAEMEACGGGPPCKAAITRVLRTPFFQDYDFRARGVSVQIRCSRSLYLVGSYGCARH